MCIGLQISVLKDKFKKPQTSSTRWGGLPYGLAQQDPPMDNKRMKNRESDTNSTIAILLFRRMFPNAGHGQKKIYTKIWFITVHNFIQF